MAWRYIDPLLENATKHSTIFGKYWIVVIVIFRLVGSFISGVHNLNVK